MLHRIINKMKGSNIGKRSNTENINKKQSDELNEIKDANVEDKIELILKSSFRNDFIKFCIKKQIYENILFYHDISMYKKQPSDKMKKRLSIHIHDKYIKTDAPHEINICGKTKLTIESEKNSDGKYDNAFSQVKEMLIEQVNIFLKQMNTKINNK